MNDCMECKCSYQRWKRYAGGRAVHRNPGPQAEKKVKGEATHASIAEEAPPLEPLPSTVPVPVPVPLRAAAAAAVAELRALPVSSMDHLFEAVRLKVMAMAASREDQVTLLLTKWLQDLNQQLLPVGQWELLERELTSARDSLTIVIGKPESDLEAVRAMRFVIDYINQRTIEVKQQRQPQQAVAIHGDGKVGQQGKRRCISHISASSGPAAASTIAQIPGQGLLSVVHVPCDDNRPQTPNSSHPAVAADILLPSASERLQSRGGCPVHPHMRQIRQCKACKNLYYRLKRVATEAAMVNASKLHA